MPFFEYNRHPVFYQKTGGGPAVMLLHGFGEDHRIWDRQTRFLSDSYTVIRPDVPGTGQSALQPALVQIGDYAACIAALAQHEGLQQFTLLGHSMGGYISLAFAETWGNLLNGWGLIHATAFADTDEKKAMRTKGIETIKAYGAPAFIRSTAPNLFSATFKQNNQAAINNLVELGLDFTNEALEQYYIVMRDRPNRTHVLKNTPLPVLFVIGTEDNAAPLADLLEQVHLPKTAAINILEGVGHMSMIEAPDQLNQHLMEFLNLVHDR